MAVITIRKLTIDEAGEAAYRLNTYAFMPTPPLPKKDEFVERVIRRGGTTYFGALECELVQVIAGSHAMTQQVRGKIYTASGLFAVSSHPSVRRKGIARRVIQELLVDMRARGTIFSILYPFRESFYERLGYIPYPRARYVHFKPANVEPLLKHDLKGQVELGLNTENQDDYIAFTRKVQAGVHGMAVFDAPPLTFPQRFERWIALAKVAGETVGAMVYSMQNDVITQFTLQADNFYYTTPQGRYLLLEWIARHLNQASEIKLWLAPYEFPETWYPDLDYTLGIMTTPPMGRVLDVAHLGGMQTGSGRFAVRIIDPFCPWNEGVWSFETVTGKLSVESSGNPDCDLTIQGLSALVYGLNDPAEFAFRGWGEPSVETQASMRSLFPRMTPYMHERF